MEHLHRFSTRRQLDAQNATSSLDYCELRALGLTEGPIPNRAPESMAIIWSLFGLSTVFLALRVYCKIWRSRGLWWDDHILIASWLCFLGDAVMSQRAFDYGFGHYPCDINPANFSKILFEGSGLGASFGILAIVWSKTSFAFTILRISKDRLRYFVIGLTVVMNIAMALQLLFVWIRCNPIEKSWKLAMIEGKCWDMRTTDIYGVFAGSLSGVADIILALLPWRLLWGLQMKKKERVGVMVAMSMGVFVGVVSFVKSSLILTRSGKNFTCRLPSIYYPILTLAASLRTFQLTLVRRMQDYGSALLSWAAIEIGLTIIACCIPVLRVLFRDLRNSSIKKSERGDSYGISGSSGISARGMKYNTTVVSWGAESRKGSEWMGSRR